MKIKIPGILSSTFLIFLPYSVSSASSNFESSVQMLKNGEIEQFEDISEGNRTALLEVDENGITLLEYAVFIVGDDQGIYGYPQVVMSLLDEDFEVNQDYKETLIKRILLAIRSLDKINSRVDLSEDMKSDLDRSAFVELLSHVVMTSNGEHPALSEELAIISILQICNKGSYSTSDTERANVESLSQIYGTVPDTQRLFLKSYVETNILDANCIQSFTRGS